MQSMRLSQIGVGEAGHKNVMKMITTLGQTVGDGKMRAVRSRGHQQDL